MCLYAQQQRALSSRRADIRGQGRRQTVRPGAFFSQRVYREVSRVVMSALETDWIKVISAAELVEHAREFEAALEFPQGKRSLDGCHFPVSPPQTNAANYRNYRGWSSRTDIIYMP
ncbi:hypothetical protein HPB47_019953 [Ixodes persulcatus]|uniref:Uncharacterized protein n=1 Tax=Ixodes persulcatus TaxID=34615 RepID=A0AC60QGR8_IXOPE|nr:hypothetical protein HPB47_019953 [Ixodes persulcatus]